MSPTLKCCLEQQSYILLPKIVENFFPKKLGAGRYYYFLLVSSFLASNRVSEVICNFWVENIQTYWVETYKSWQLLNIPSGSILLHLGLAKCARLPSHTASFHWPPALCLKVTLGWFWSCWTKSEGKVWASMLPSCCTCLGRRSGWHGAQ